MFKMSKPMSENPLPFFSLFPKTDHDRFLMARLCFIEMRGNNGLRFAAPVALISRLSVPFEALVNNALEAAHASAALEVANKDTFYRFYQFVYTGTYDGFKPVGCTKKTAPLPVETSTKMEDGIRCVANPFAVAPQMADKTDSFKLPCSLVSRKAALHEFMTPLVPCKRKLAESSDDRAISIRSELKSNTISAFMRNYEQLTGGDDSDFMRFGTETEAGHKQPSFANVFLGHARIWRLADTYAITTLMDVARSRLARELAAWVITDSGFVRDFGSLVRYLYIDCNTEGSALKLLIAQFAACVVEDVKNLEGWPELVKEVPAFGVDLVDQMGN